MRHNPESLLREIWKHSLTKACLLLDNYQTGKSQGLVRREKGRERRNKVLVIFVQQRFRYSYLKCVLRE